MITFDVIKKTRAHELPDEVLSERIYAFFEDSPAMILRLGLVCKGWNGSLNNGEYARAQWAVNLKKKQDKWKREWKAGIRETKVTSCTGKWLYSDCFVQVGQTRQGLDSTIDETPLLNKIERWGFFGGLARMILAIIHTIGHTLALVFNAIKGERKKCEGHYYHIQKGGLEFVRGFITSIPIVGRIAAWKKDVFIPVCPHFFGRITIQKKSFFLLRIRNPDKPNYFDNPPKIYEWRVTDEIFNHIDVRRLGFGRPVKLVLWNPQDMIPKKEGLRIYRYNLALSS